MWRKSGIYKKKSTSLSHCISQQGRGRTPNDTLAGRERGFLEQTNAQLTRIFMERIIELCTTSTEDIAACMLDTTVSCNIGWEE